MIKENSIPTAQLQSDLAQRLSPSQRIISSQNLSYLPNLYYREYKLIESLNHERYDFPEQKILVPRSKTSWDAVLCQMRQKAELRKQIKKFKIAQNYHVSKVTRDQFIKKQLKKQQKELFHRIIFNQLSQDVRQFFKGTDKKEDINVEPNLKSKQSELKKAEQPKGRIADDIFIDKDEGSDDIGGGIDLFEFLNTENNHRQPLDIINNQRKEQQENLANKRSIRDYINDFLSKENQIIDEKDQYTESHISRKSCLKKINQNLRKRLKHKDAETQDRSLTSATVALSNLINNYPECKSLDNFIEIPSFTQWIFDQNRGKRKKDEQFQLKWDDENMEKFRDMNEKFDVEKLKDLPTVLQLSATRQQYPKLFERNISTHYQFPHNIESIKSFSRNFDSKKFYYNEFHDSDYEKFVMRNNKRKLLGKFEKNSNYMFAEHYTQDQIENNEKISMGRMFLYPPNKISDRIIYKVTPGTTKISAIAKDYNKKVFPLSREKVILLSYLVNKYLTQFGNNWKAITQFIEIFPCFSNYLIKPQLVQQLYQIVNRHELKLNYLDNLEIWNKRILPSSQNYNGSYKDYQTVVNETKKVKKAFKQDAMTDESSEPIIEEVDTSNKFSLDNYEKLLKQPLGSSHYNKKIFGKVSRRYKQYGTKLCARTTNQIYNFYQHKVIKAHKVIEQYRNTYGVVKIDLDARGQGDDRAASYVAQTMKGQVKSGLPFRKKKNINERNNQLVKILQALRSKNTGAPVNPPKPGTQAPKPQQTLPKTTPPPQVVPQVQTNPVSVPPPVIQPPAQKAPDPAVQKKTKTPQKRVGGGIKKPRKDKPQEQKK